MLQQQIENEKTEILRAVDRAKEEGTYRSNRAAISSSERRPEVASSDTKRKRIKSREKEEELLLTPSSSNTKNKIENVNTYEEKGGSSFPKFQTEIEGQETPTQNWATTPIDISQRNKNHSRWDRREPDTPASRSLVDPRLVLYGATPLATPGLNAMDTPISHDMIKRMTPQQLKNYRIEQEMGERNKPLTDEDLDNMLPQEGYEIVLPPKGYVPLFSTQRNW